MLGIPEDCRIFPKSLLSGADEKCRIERMENYDTEATQFDMRHVGYLYIK